MLKAFPGFWLACLLAAQVLYGQDPTQCIGSKDSSDGQTFEDNGGTGSFSGTVSNACGPLTSATSSVPWVSVTSFTTFAIQFSVLPNSTPSSRTGSVTATFGNYPPGPVSFTFTLTQFARLGFTTGSPLPVGVVGLPYSVQLQAAGGTGVSRSFSILGSLPGGLFLTGQTISGTPTTAGTSMFTAQVTDLDPHSGAPFSATQGYALTINPRFALSTTSLPGAMVGTPYLANLAATGGIPPYNWSLGGALPQTLSLNSAAGVISGTPNSNTQGTYPLTIQVTDQANESLSLPVTLHVAPPPLAITNSSLSPATEGVSYSAGFSASGGTPPYSWTATGLPSWLKLSSAGQLSGTPPTGSAGAYNFTVNVQDATSQMMGAAVSLQVNPAPLSIITTSPLPDGTVGSAYGFSFQAIGGKGPYQWAAVGLPAFLKLAASGGISGMPPAGSAGPYSFTVSVGDTLGNKVSGMFSLTVDPLNSPPAPLSIVSELLTPATEGVPYSAGFSASGGTPPYSWTATGLPSWLKLTSAGQLSGTPPAGSAGAYDFTVNVQDANSKTTGVGVSLQVNPAPLSIFTTSPLPDGREGSSYGFSFQAIGGKGPYQWAAVGLPVFLKLAASGSISGMPPVGSAGPHSFTVSVSDTLGHKASGMFSLTVDPLNSPPAPLSIVSELLTPATEGVTYSVGFSASGGTPPYSWTATGLPSWLKLTSAGQLSGTPPAGSAGAYHFTVNVQDANSKMTGAGISLQVNQAPLAIITTSLPDGKEGSVYGFSFQAIGGKGPYQWAALGLPAFLKLAGSGSISGMPPAGSAGPYSFTVSVTDALGTKASVTFGLKVDSRVSIALTSSLPQGTEGLLYSVTLTAKGGTPPYTWSGNGLPIWAKLSTSGVLSGTPPIGSAGASLITVTTTDAANDTESALVTLVVLAAGGGVTITTPSLPDGTVGANYQFALNATGGTPPYQWSGSGVPDGVTLASNGQLSGTPTSAGDTNVTVQATDANHSVAFAALSLHIAPSALTIVSSIPLPFAEVSVPYFTMFQSSGGTRPLSWSLVSGSLPPGLSLDPNGVLSGIPTETGPFDFVLGVAEVGAGQVSLVKSAGRRAKDATVITATAGYEVVVHPFVTPDLVISCGSLSFEAPSQNSAPLQTCSVISSIYNSIPFSASADVPWLSLSTGGVTPGRIDVAADPSGLTPGVHNATINVTSPGLATKTIQVSLTTNQSSGILHASPSALSLSSPGSPQFSKSIFVQNVGQGDLDFTTSADVPWLQVSPQSGTLSAGASLTLQVTVLVQGLAPGVYLGNIEIESPSGSIEIPTNVLISKKRPKMILSRDGILLVARQGNGVSGPSPTTFLVRTDGTDIHYTVQQIGGEGWLSLESDPHGMATAAAPGKVAFQARSAGLPKGAYYARVRITAPEPFDPLLDFLVVLDVAAATTAPVPNPDPSGLVFATTEGPNPASQAVSVYTSSDLPLPYQVAVTTESGGDWLSASPVGGMLSTGTPAQLTVSVNAANLMPGIYRGGVNISISNLEVRTVNVTLIVPALSSESHIVSGHAAGPASCTPTNLVVTETGLAGNFSTPAAWPSFIEVQLSDDCGNPIANGDVVADFSNGDSPLPLLLTDSKMAVYSATWTPVYPTSQLTITMQAAAPGLNSGMTQVVGGVSDTPYPILKQNSTVHNLYPRAGAPLAPGTIVSIFGSALAHAPTTGTGPLPTVLGGTSVVIGGELAPLYYVSDNQINAQLPADLLPDQEYQVVVSANGGFSTPDSIRIDPATPGVARLANGQVIAQHQDFSQVTPDSPAKPGEYLVIYLAGMGLTSTPVSAGALSPTSPLASVSIPPSLTLNGEPVKVLFAGLSPGFVGLYQINFQVPTDAKSGSLELQISQAGVAANTSVLVVGK